MATLPKVDNTKNSVVYTRINLKKGQVISPAQLVNYQSIDSLNDALSTAGYTDDQLNVLSKNDKVYALRKVHGLV